MPLMTPTRDDLAHELEVLQDLVRSEGWRVFVEHCEADLRGDGFFRKITVALAGNDPVEPKVIHRTALEVAMYVTWPKRRIEEILKRAKVSA